jgi:hypothetical protein
MRIKKETNSRLIGSSPYIFFREKPYSAMLYIESNIVSLGVPVYGKKQNREKIKLSTFGLQLQEYCHHDIKKEKVLLTQHKT